MLSHISGRFWIVAAREEIRVWENECCECKRHRNKPATQIMGPLPQVRLRFTFRAPTKEVVVCFYMLIDSSSSSRSGVGA